MSMTLYDENLQNTVTQPIVGKRYVLLRTRAGAADRTFSSTGATLTTPPARDIPVASLAGAWNPTGQDNAPAWATITDGYAIQFTSTGDVQVTVGSEQATYSVSSPPPEPEHFSVKVLQFDAAWLHTVFVCDISYSGTSNLVLLRASDVGTGRILAADIESDGTYEFWCEYDDQTGDALVHISPAPWSDISVRAVIIGDTR